MEISNLPEKYKAVFGPDNQNWYKDHDINLVFLFSVQRFMNDLLQMRGHVFLNEVYDALHMPRTYEGQVVGWARDGEADCFIDFNPSSRDDDKIELDFNIDGTILEYLPRG